MYETNDKKITRKTKYIMKCSYCGKTTRDMVEHLEKSKSCSQQHAEKLCLQFKHILVEHKKEVEDDINT